jgi:hypothetical protein
MVELCSLEAFERQDVATGETPHALPFRDSLLKLRNRRFAA